MVLSSSTLKTMNEPTVQLNLKILHSEEDGSVVTHERFEMSADKFRILHNEFKDVRQLMDEHMK